MSSIDQDDTFSFTREYHDLYLQRLGLDSVLVEAPTSTALAAITEAHVGRIPFENLSQHGAQGGLQTLRMETVANKILRRHRGGFCFEVNGLLAEWLLSLGYQVKRVPAHVHAGEFRDLPTHMILLVTTNDRTEWLVDVGFGEPSIHPLQYVMDLSQTTPEGMESRIVVCDQDDRDIILEWKKADALWSPRLKWKKEDTVNGIQLAEFAPYLQLVLEESSIFALKMITCKIDRHEKRTLSGTRYKITSPRFGQQSKVSVRQLASDDEVRQVLMKDFGIPWDETISLATAKSDNADAALFAQL